MKEKTNKFTKWYLDIIQNAELISYSSVKGTIIFRPDCYEIWEHIQKEFNKYLMNERIRNTYFPTLIPENFFKKESEHIKGFSPELPWVTKIGNEKLKEPLALRPTSETIIGMAFSNWINSYRDLPYEINQWANVFRWEKKTLPLLRNSEFLWQEGHTAHANETDARQRTLAILNEYERLCENFLSIPVYKGKKTPLERFAGAIDTYSIEAMMQDGKAVQVGTSHYMGTKFSKAFNITYLNKENKSIFSHSTSWGISTRIIGALIMVHGDQKGLVLPPNVAPVQVVLVPAGAWKKNPNVMKRLDKIFFILKEKGYRIHLDDSTNSIGYKFNHWDLKGACIRIECGPRDLENTYVMVKIRDLEDKKRVKLEELEKYVDYQLSNMGKRMLKTAYRKNKENEHIHIETLDDLISHIEISKAQNKKSGFVLIGWDGSKKTELIIKEKTGFTIRNIPFNPPIRKYHDVVSGNFAKETVWIARSY